MNRNTTPEGQPLSGPVYVDEHDRAVTRVARVLLRWVPVGGAEPSDLRRRLASRDRPLFDDAVRRLVYGQRIELVESYDGARLYVPVDGVAAGVQASVILHGVLDDLRRLEETVRGVLDAVEIERGRS